MLEATKVFVAVKNIETPDERHAFEHASRNVVNLPGVTIVGGGATEDGKIGETFQFCGDVVSSNSISAMLLAGDFAINAGAALVGMVVIGAIVGGWRAKALAPLAAS